MTEQLTDAARKLGGAGTDCLPIYTNTMHLLADAIEQHVSIPRLHIADAAAAILKQHNADMCGLLGTAFTLQKPFYKQRPEAHSGINTLVLDEQAQKVVHGIIYDE